MVRHLEGLGYLSAEVDRPIVQRKPESRSYETFIKTRTGPRYDLGLLQFEGNAAITDKELQDAVRAKTGDQYLPKQGQEFTQALVEFYYNKGYREARIETTEQRADGYRQDRPSIQHTGKPSGRDFRHSGRGQRQYQRGVSPAAGSLRKGGSGRWGKTQPDPRRLFNSGTYSMVDLTLQPAASETTRPSAKANPISTQPLDLKLRVRERKPFSLDYGPTYDATRGAGVIVDFSNRNILGEGRYLGYRVLVDTEHADQRLYFSQPFLGRSNINTLFDLTREDSRIDDLRMIEQSATAQQQIEFRRRFTFSYGYRVERANSTITSEGTTVPQAGTTSSILSTLIRDTRDDMFDATLGSYTSHSFQVAPKALGGSQGYTRYFGHFQVLRPDPAGQGPLRRGEPSAIHLRRRNPSGIFETDWGHYDQSRRSLLRRRRFDGARILPERPRPQRYQRSAAGWAISALPEYGAPHPAVQAARRGGILRHRDVAKHSDFSLTDLRKTAGFGIRIRNPFIMIRFDYGWKLDRRPWESRGAFHFSIGQAF